MEDAGMGRNWYMLASGSLIILGCGSRSGIVAGPLTDDGPAVYPWQGSANGGSPRSPRSCVEDWRTLYEGEGIIPTALAVSDGEVIFAVARVDGTLPQIRALDIESASGSSRVIDTGLPYDDLWLEANELLLWSSDRLVRVPLEGGSDEVLLNPRDADPSIQVDSILVQGDAFYWAQTRSDLTQLEVWQQPRSGGRPRLIARMDRGELYPPLLLAATPKLIVVAGGTTGVALSLQGGAPQPLDQVADGELVGIDGLGAYYVRPANRTRRGGRALEFELRRAPVDGSPTTVFWRGSAGHRLDRLWPADSGWLATGAYYMFDGTPHAVIVHIDDAGNEVLVACDRADNDWLSRAVFWQEAFYAITRAGNLWRIVEIRLPD
jgi:hypothetical protein